MTRTTERGISQTLGWIAVGLVIVGLVTGCGDRVAPGQVETPRTVVAESDTRLVEEMTMPSVEWASGDVVSARHTAIASRVLARIEEVRVRAGSSVRAGDVLVVLDARDLKAQLGEAGEALRAAEARLELALQEQARAEGLVERGVAPQRQLDEANSELRSARADVGGRQSARDQARTAVSFSEIRANVNGRVIDRLAEPGETAVPGVPLLRVYDPTLLRVEAPVRESLAVGLGVGQVLRVDLPALGEVFEGRIDEIVPFAERGSRTLLVKVSLPRTNPRLFAGMFARVAIPGGERVSLLVPGSAIARIGQLEFATVVNAEGVSERRLVTTGGFSIDGRVEVLSGLAPGERVFLPEVRPESRTAAPG